MKVTALLKWTVTISLLGWLLSGFDLPQAFAVLGRADLTLTASAFLLSILVILTMAFRWDLLLRALKAGFSSREVTRATFIGYFFGSVLPTLGGDVARMSCLAKGRGRHVELALSILVDRYLGLLALFGLGVLAIGMHSPVGRLRPLLHFAYLATGAALALALVVALLARMTDRTADRLTKGMPRRLAEILARIRSAVDLYAARKTVLLEALAISVGSQLLSIGIYYALAVGLDAGAHPLDFLYGIPAVNLAVLVPVSAGGIGVGEWTFVYVFTDLGMSPDVALAVSLLNLVARLGAALVGGVLYLIGGRS